MTETETNSMSTACTREAILLENSGDILGNIAILRKKYVAVNVAHDMEVTRRSSCQLLIQQPTLQQSSDQSA